MNSKRKASQSPLLDTRCVLFDAELRPLRRDLTVTDVLAVSSPLTLHHTVKYGGSIFQEHCPDRQSTRKVDFFFLFYINGSSRSWRCIAAKKKRKVHCSIVDAVRVLLLEIVRDWNRTLVRELMWRLGNPRWTYRSLRTLVWIAKYAHAKSC